MRTKTALVLMLLSTLFVASLADDARTGHWIGVAFADGGRATAIIDRDARTVAVASRIVQISGGNEAGEIVGGSRNAFTRWELSGVVFTDGGTAIGIFDFDDTSGTVERWSIQISGGDEMSLPPVLLIPSTSTWSGGSGFNDFVFLVTGSERQFRIAPVKVLNGESGPLALDLANAAANVDCFNCDPFRFIAAGQVINLPQPGTSTLSRAALVVLGLLGVSRRSRRRARRSWEARDHRGAVVSA